MAFHEVRFPTDISAGSRGGPERRTEVVSIASGYEERNQRWANSRRRYDASYGIQAANDVYEVLDFFEERRGKFHGFRWKDWFDYKSCSPEDTVSYLDQTLGTGDAAEDEFLLLKTYGVSFAPWTRYITKPVSGTVVVAVAGVLQTENTDYMIDLTTGLITFLAGHIPGVGDSVTAGFEFDVPVRFDTDHLEVTYDHAHVVSIASVPVVEIRV